MAQDKPEQGAEGRPVARNATVDAIVAVVLVIIGAVEMIEARHRRHEAALRPARADREPRHPEDGCRRDLARSLRATIIVPAAAPSPLRH